jgi:N-dimethylarginine dimethylaminohydrolase
VTTRPERTSRPAWSVDSETGALREVLLCRPEHYRWIPTNAVAVETLKSGAALDQAALAAQYGEMEAALGESGVACRYLEPDPHLPYQVYTRDSSFTTPWGPVVAQLFRPQRRGEVAALAEFHRAAAVAPWRWATAASLEGGDVHLVRPGLLVLGYSGERTHEDGARQCAGWFEAAGWRVRLVPFAEHFLHLDLLFCMVAEGIALACLDVLDEDLVAWLRTEGIELVPTSYREAMRLEGNVLALGNGRVLSSAHAEGVNRRLRAAGLTVLDPDLSLFARGGGGVHCMTCPLRRDSQAG